MALLRFLHALLVGTTKVSPKISGLNTLPAQALDCFPALSDCWRHALILDLCIHPRNGLHKCTLHELTLGISGSQKDAVDNEQHPGAFSECEGGQEDAEPQSDLKKRNKGHGSIIIFLDEFANTVC